MVLSKETDVAKISFFKRFLLVFSKQLVPCTDGKIKMSKASAAAVSEQAKSLQDRWIQVDKVPKPTNKVEVQTFLEYVIPLLHKWQKASRCNRSGRKEEHWLCCGE